MSHICYILANDRGVTYNGYTNNPTRRLRQHNGEITGGARSTQNKGPWHFIAMITSDDPRFDKRKALSLEWHIRYPTNKKPRPPIYKGPQGRLDALELVFAHPYFRDILFTVHVLPQYRVNVTNPLITVAELSHPTPTPVVNLITQYIKET